MLRIHALSLIFVGLLVSCGPSEPVGTTSRGPGAPKASVEATLAGAVELADSTLGPVISVPSSLGFGERQINTSTSQLLTVTNTGTSTLVISSITKNGPGAAAYSFFPPSVSIPAGSSTVVTVAFSPTAQGQANASLILGTNDPANATVVVSLFGTGVNPSIIVPTEVSFGEQIVGSSTQRTLTVSNVGTGTLLVTNAVIGGTGAAAYSVTPSSLSVAAGQTASLVVTFAPTAQGGTTATLTLTTNDVARSTVAIVLVGTGVKPTISWPSSANFGAVQVNTSATQTLTVSNTGTGTLNVSSITKSGANAAAFTFSPSTLSVPAGGSANVTVVFAPTAEGVASAALTLATNDPAHSAVTVALAGTGVSPTIAVQPSLAFGEQAVNTSTQRTLTVTNIGTGTLVIGSVVLSGTASAAFSVTPNALSIPEGASANLVVVFAPTSFGAASASLTLTTNDVTHPTVVVALSGTGASPTISVPSSVSFGAVQVNTSATQTLTVSNTGTGILNISSIIKSGPNAAAFTFSPSMLSIQAGGSAALTVVFSPTAEGAASATLTLNSNDVARPTVSIALSGVGGGAIATVSPSVLDFGGVRVGASRQLTVTVANTGTSPLVVSSVTSVIPVFSYVGPATFTVAPNSSFSFQVSFSPGNTVNYTGTLVLTSNASNSPTVVSMTGVGTTAQLTVSPSVLSFGDVRVGAQSPRMAVTVVNSGSGEAVLQSLPVAGPFVAALHTGDVLPKTIPAAGSFTFDVIFKPTQPGDATGAVSIVSDAGGPLVVSATGTGTVAKLQWSAASLDFGAQRLGQPSGTFPVIVSNPGTAELEITQFIFSQSAFTLVLSPPPSEGAPLRIAPGQQKALLLTFTPAALGVTTGKLFAISNALEPAAPLELAGTGVDGQLSMTPASLSFGQVAVGSSVQQTVVLKNTGTYPLKIVQVAPPVGPFTVLGLPTGLVVQPSESWPFTVTFAPPQQASFTATSLITSDCVTNPQFSLVMTGTGGTASPSLHLSASQVAFGNVLVGGSSSPYTLTLSNTGTTPLTLSALSLGGADSAAFTLTGPSLPTVLQPAQSLSVVMVFHPDADRAFSGLLSVASSDPVTPSVTIPLTGTGIIPQIHLSDTALDFGRQLVGSTSSPRKVRIINSGSIPVTLSAVTIEGAGASQFSLVAPPTLPLVVAAGQEQELQVSFTPQAEADASGTLRLGFADPAPRLEAALHGQGVRPVLSVSPWVLDFGGVAVGELAPAQELSVSNPSSQALQVTVRLRDDGSAFSVDAGALAAPVPPGGSASFKVSFLPTAVGAAENEVQVLAQGLTEPAAHFTVKGTGTEPASAHAPESQKEEPQVGCSSSGAGAGGSGLLALLVLAAVGSRRGRQARG